MDEGASRLRIEELRTGKNGTARQALEQQLSDAVRNSNFEQAAKLRDQLQKLSGKQTEARRSRALSGSDVAAVVAERTGIPVGKLTTGERERLLRLEQLLAEHVVGQEKAVSAVAEAVRRGYSGIRDADRPVACLMFTGPTGVGKTELCRALAAEMYGSKDAMIRLDMTEYMEKQSVARLIGAPPGYVGYEEGGKLTEAVRRRPHCLVLLDELEKAHPDVAGILLQIMEEGVLTDSTGRRVSFKNAVVVMTSNAGAQQRGEGLGFHSGGEAARREDTLRQYFTPEFLGRLDGIIGFELLSGDSMERVARKYLNRLCGRVKAQGTVLTLPEELPAFLCEGCKGKEGARQLRRLVQSQVEGPLAAYLLQCAKKPPQVTALLREGKLCFLPEFIRTDVQK